MQISYSLEILFFLFFIKYKSRNSLALLTDKSAKSIMLIANTLNDDLPLIERLEGTKRLERGRLGREALT